MTTPLIESPTDLNPRKYKDVSSRGFPEDWVGVWELLYDINQNYFSVQAGKEQIKPVDTTFFFTYFVYQLFVAVNRLRLITPELGGDDLGQRVLKHLPIKIANLHVLNDRLSEILVNLFNYGFLDSDNSKYRHPELRMFFPCVDKKPRTVYDVNANTEPVKYSTVEDMFFGTIACKQFLDNILDVQKRKKYINALVESLTHDIWRLFMYSDFLLREFFKHILYGIDGVIVKPDKYSPLKVPESALENMLNYIRTTNEISTRYDAAIYTKLARDESVLFSGYDILTVKDVLKTGVPTGLNFTMSPLCYSLFKAIYLPGLPFIMVKPFLENYHAEVIRERTSLVPPAYWHMTKKDPQNMIPDVMDLITSNTKEHNGYDRLRLYSYVNPKYESEEDGGFRMGLTLRSDHTHGSFHVRLTEGLHTNSEKVYNIPTTHNPDDDFLNYISAVIHPPNYPLSKSSLPQKPALKAAPAVTQPIAAEQKKPQVEPTPPVTVKAPQIEVVEQSNTPPITQLPDIPQAKSTSPPIATAISTTGSPVCPDCKKPFTPESGSRSPRLLACSHVVCQECLKRADERSQDYKCPTCGTVENRKYTGIPLATSVGLVSPAANPQTPLTGSLAEQGFSVGPQKKQQPIVETTAIAAKQPAPAVSVPSPAVPAVKPPVPVPSPAVLVPSPAVPAVKPPVPVPSPAPTVGNIPVASTTTTVTQQTMVKSEIGSSGMLQLSQLFRLVTACLAYNSSYVLDRRFRPLCFSKDMCDCDNIVIKVGKRAPHCIFANMHDATMIGQLIRFFPNGKAVGFDMKRGQDVVPVKIHPDAGEIYSILPTSIFYKYSAKTPLKCNNCARGFKSENMPIQLECGHLICQKCSLKIISVPRVCPVCKTTLNAAGINRTLDDAVTVLRAKTDFFINPIYYTLLEDCAPNSLKATVFRFPDSANVVLAFTDEITEGLHRIGNTEYGKELGIRGAGKHRERFAEAKRRLYSILRAMDKITDDVVITAIKANTPNMDLPEIELEEMNPRTLYYIEYLLLCNRDFFE